jgi:hypothetical protein
MFLPISVLLAIAETRAAKALERLASVARPSGCSPPRRARAAHWLGGSPAALAAGGLLLAAVALPEFAQTEPSDAPHQPAPPEQFGRYVALERNFDPALAQLYAEDAVIRNRRTYPGGEVRERTMTASQLRQLIRLAMPIAKSRGDRSSYSDCSYAPEARGVRIQCLRFSRLKQSTSPLSLLVAPTPQRQWRILEEDSESRA